MKHKIHVSQEDITKGVKEDQHACMVWRAVIRNLQLETEGTNVPIEVAVDYGGVSFEGPDGRITVAHDSETEQHIRDFDIAKNRVKPFDFELDLPDDWREQIGQFSND